MQSLDLAASQIGSHRPAYALLALDCLSHLNDPKVFREPLLRRLLSEFSTQVAWDPLKLKDELLERVAAASSCS